MFLKITFVLPTMNLSGGSRVISIYSRLLVAKGHQVTVVTPSSKTTIIQKLKGKMLKQEPFKIKFDDTFFKDVNYDLKILDTNRAVLENDVPDADIIIATFWYTAEWIKQFSSKKGKKVYFIQHYEMHPWLPTERVVETFYLPFKKIVVSKWISERLEKNHGISDVKVIGNGVEHDLFNAPIRTKQKTLTVGVMYADEKSFKGCDISFASIEEARKTMPEIKVISFASHPPKESLPLLENTTFHLKPEQNELKNIYSACDVWLFGSRLEGFGLPILEAMACRTPVIATKTGVAPEILSDGAAGFLIDIDDIKAMSSAILSVGNMTNSEWEKMSFHAFTETINYDWDSRVDMLSSALAEYIKNE